MSYKLEVKGMPVFDICEPYLTLMMENKKKLETRNYPFPEKMKGTVLIHKPIRVMKTPEFWKDTLVTDISNKGCITAIAELRECYEVTDEFIKSLTKEELNSGFYWLGRYAWKLENIRYVKPIKVRGHQGFYYYTGEVEVY